jgi:hypothetical protein
MLLRAQAKKLGYCEVEVAEVVVAESGGALSLAAGVVEAWLLLAGWMMMVLVLVRPRRFPGVSIY